MRADALLLTTLLLACKRDGTHTLTFREAPGSPHTLGAGASDAVLADVDGDGDLDVVVSTANEGALHLLRGDGKGGFAPTQILARAPGMHAVAVADVDRDGDLDVLATQHDSHDVTVLLGDGNGAFTTAGTFAARTQGAAHNHGLAIADFDEDGALDVLTSDQAMHGVALLRGDGRGAFTIAAGSPWSVGAAAYPPAVADLDGDGHADVVSPLVGGAAVAVLSGDGKGGFTPAAGAPGPLRERPYAVAIGEVTGDASLDVVVAHDDLTIATLLAGDGKGGLAPVAELELGGRGFDPRLVDIDADGALDLVASCHPSGVAVLRGDGKGGFVAFVGSPFAVGRSPSGAAAGDLDADGRLDLAVVGFDSGDLTVLLQR